jgi:hypothetical protein
VNGSSSSLSTLCPKCGRRVPTPIGTCRCGQSIEHARPETNIDTTGHEEKRGASPASIAALTLVLTIGVVIAVMMWVRHDARPLPRPTAAAAVPAQKAAEEPPAAAPEPMHNPFEDLIPPSKPASSQESESHPPLALEDLINKTMPAVVRIESTAGTGSGFFVRPDTILTNAHVVTTNNAVTVRRPDGSTVRGRVERTVPEYDIAIVRVDESRPGQATIPLGSVEHARTGQEVIAVGSPLGLQNTVTRGIVSAVRKVDDLTLVQTDAAINPGNSGGPLLNRQGEAIGITTMAARQSQGLSFAVAIDHANDVLSGRHVVSNPNALTPIDSFNRAAGSTGSGAAQPSSVDRIRDEGSSVYEQRMTQIGRQADQLDSYWNRFKNACYEGRITGSFEREWFALFDPRAMPGTVAPGCEAMFRDVRRMADDIRSGVASADESARQADVFPGVRRGLRQRFRLDLVR